MLITKTKKCKVCRNAFVPRSAFAKACSPECAQNYAIKDREAKARKQATKERKATKERLDALRTKPQLVALAQKAFNEWVRARDYGKPCICCGKPIAWGAGATGGVCDAGHYRSRGSAPHLRFNEDNVHAQLKHCNDKLGGNHVNYRQGLIERIGLERVEILEADQTPRRYTKEGLIELAKQYRAKTRELLKGKA